MRINMLHLLSLLILLTISLPVRSSGFECICFNNGTLDCDRMNLRAIAPSQEECRPIHLTASYNDITVLQGSSLNGYEDLTSLNVIHSKLFSIRDGFSGLKKLMSVDLSHNYLSHISDDVFSGNKELKTVSLAHNNLESLPKFPDSLVDLDISYNKINIIYSLNILNLNTINLDGNRLGYISEEIIDVLFNIPVATFSDNPWLCRHNFEYIMCRTCSKAINQGQNCRTMKCTTKSEKEIVYKPKSQIITCRTYYPQMFVTSTPVMSVVTPTIMTSLKPNSTHHTRTIAPTMEYVPESNEENEDAFKQNISEGMYEYGFHNISSTLTTVLFSGDLTNQLSNQSAKENQEEEITTHQTVDNEVFINWTVVVSIFIIIFIVGIVIAYRFGKYGHIIPNICKYSSYNYVDTEAGAGKV